MVASRGHCSLCTDMIWSSFESLPRTCACPELLSVAFGDFRPNKAVELQSQWNWPFFAYLHTYFSNMPNSGGTAVTLGGAELCPTCSHTHLHANSTSGETYLALGTFWSSNTCLSQDGQQ